MKVRIPTPLRSYTSQQTVVEAEGVTIAEVLLDLDRQFPGLRFRVVDEQGQLRKHMKIFVNEEAIRDLDAPVHAADEVVLMQALSGGATPLGRQAVQGSTDGDVLSIESVAAASTPLGAIT